MVIKLTSNSKLDTNTNFSLLVDTLDNSPPMTNYQPQYVKTLLISLFMVAIVSLPSCSWIPTFKFPGAYKITVQQGNVIEQKDVDELKKGMSKKQVKYVMGNPLLIDTFNQNRWDYYYSKKDPKGHIEEKKLTLFFIDGKLNSFRGDYTPSAFEEVATSEAS